ncbi:hypothetical protein [Bradyrhizobium sp. S3.7.6]
MMRAEIADLTDLVMSLRDRIEDVLTKPEPKPEPEPIVEKLSTRSKKAIEYVSAGWNSIEALARDMELPLKIALRKLDYLAKTDRVEIMRGQCRLKPAPAEPLQAELLPVEPLKSNSAPVISENTRARRLAREAKALATIKSIPPRKRMNGHTNGQGAN